MSSKVKINQDIFNALKRCDSHQFNIIEIRNMIQKESEQYENSSVARLFVARSLNRLVSLGVLQTDGEGRKRTFTKSENFDSTHFKIVSKRKKLSTKQQVPKGTEWDDAKTQLEAERQSITAELTVVLAEIDEYQGLMKRFKSLQSFIQPSYQEATKKSAKLMAQLNVWTNTISLINQGITREKEC
ncbi:hypothetical protein [Vibrio rotiferianus]|uniref:hypothetical protein n=1 Tax=Vibrio rotiferianus TaxID=190895 RepID=UPI00249144BA|nr:hypothetical protein [Vibrio rotiferianus]MBE4054629.1 hypothetical protein [Vibrio parahaemolyticus]